MTREQTLVVESGHPLGFSNHSPKRPCHHHQFDDGGHVDNQKDWHTAMQMGVANYGQMTAGGWMYIGPQGIVHGTFNTLLNAGRMKLGIPQDGNLRGRLFVSSGLGGMSGAQPKAAEMAGAAAIIAEVDSSRIETRHTQGWVGQHITSDSLEEAFSLARQAMDRESPVPWPITAMSSICWNMRCRSSCTSIYFSDQTSCHAIYEGGYCPAGLTFEQRTHMLHENPSKFRCLVDASGASFQGYKKAGGTRHVLLRLWELLHESRLRCRRERNCSGRR